jgi:hypothetical protein
MSRILSIVVLFILTFSIVYLSPAKTQIAYKLNLSGDPTTSCCNTQDILNSDGSFDEIANLAVFGNQFIDYPKNSLAQVENNSDSRVLGTKNAAGEEKWIEVSLDQQILRAWEGNKVIMEFPISSGLWYPTPKGDFGIWYKTRYQRMKGGSKELGTCYDLPNVPSNMFFYLGFGIHGAYWHNNFGHPMSHGCVNTPLVNAAQLFEWTGPIVPPGKNITKASTDNPGTRVFIH